MSFDDVLQKVEKKALGKEVGGEFPFSPQYQAIVDKYLTVGQIKERFFGVEGASKDPQLAYVRDPFWFQWMQMQQQAQQMQQQQAQQQAQGGQPPPDGGEGSPAPEGAPQEESASPTNPPAQTERQKTQAQSEASASPGQAEDLTRSLDQAIGLLSKSEAQLPPSKRKLLNKQKILMNSFLKGWEEDMKDATREILKVADKLAPKK